jgi:hypothetical protein
MDTKKKKKEKRKKEKKTEGSDGLCNVMLVTNETESMN